jgi:hypothetical protein
MPRVHRLIMVPQNLTPLPHDVGGKLSNLYVEAMAVVFGAQHLRPADPTNSNYVRAVERAIACTKNARAGWLAVRTAEMPAGDKEGAGKSAMHLAGFALELDRLGDALRWLTCARKELGSAHEHRVAQNFDYVLAHVDVANEEALLTDVLEAWRGNMPAEFRKRTDPFGYCQLEHDTETNTEALLQQMSLADAQT